MPIVVVCACGRRSSVPDQHAGKKGRCPGCGAIVVVPDLVAADGEPPDVFEPDPPLAVVDSAPSIPPTPVISTGRVPFGDLPREPDTPRVYLEVADPTVQKVFLVDVDLPFGSMVKLIFMWSLAAIPTMIVFGFVYYILLTIVSSGGEPPRR